MEFGFNEHSNRSTVEHSYIRYIKHKSPPTPAPAPAPSPTVCEVEHRPLHPDDVVPPCLGNELLKPHLEEFHRAVGGGEGLGAGAAKLPLCLLQQVGCEGAWVGDTKVVGALA